MLENDVAKLQQEIGAIKQDLLISQAVPQLDDEDSYRLATKIDLTVSRLIRLMEAKR